MIKGSLLRMKSSAFGNTCSIEIVSWKSPSTSMLAYPHIAAMKFACLHRLLHEYLQHLKMIDDPLDARAVQGFATSKQRLVGAFRFGTADHVQKLDSCDTFLVLEDHGFREVDYVYCGLSHVLLLNVGSITTVIAALTARGGVEHFAEEPKNLPATTVDVVHTELDDATESVPLLLLLCFRDALFVDSPPDWMSVTPTIVCVVDINTWRQGVQIDRTHRGYNLQVSHPCLRGQFPDNNYSTASF